MVVNAQVNPWVILGPVDAECCGLRAAYQAAMDEPLPERLLTAMEAGAAAGGDKRGTQSAA
ncbi:MAG: DUF1028 domain-containing protein, partial [Pseudomonadota bacterium]